MNNISDINNKEVVLKMSFLKQLDASLPNLIIIVFYLCFIYFLPEINVRVFLLMTVLMLVMIIPSGYLHLEYHEKTKGNIYCLNRDNLVINSPQGGTIYNVSDFKEIKLYMSLVRAAKTSPSSFNIYPYYHAKIFLNNGSVIIITSLVSDNLEYILRELYKNIPIIVVKDFYPKLE